MGGTNSSFDLDAPSFAWVVVMLYPSGHKYKEVYFPLKNGGQPKKMKRLIQRLDRAINQKTNIYGKPRYKIITLYPDEHYSRPRLF